MHYLAFDTETTGTGTSARIVELAIVYFTNGEIVEEWSQLFWPDGVDWGDDEVKKAMEINKLTEDELRGKPVFRHVLALIDEKLRGEQVWVAHNTPFDLRMLKQEYDRAGRPMPEPYPALDTMMLDVYCNRYEKSRKLVEVATRWGVPLTTAHRASVDAVTCGRILHTMLKSGRLPDTVAGLYAAQVECRHRWDEYIRSKYGKR